MKELEVLISILERDLEIASKLPNGQTQIRMEHEIKVLKEALEVLAIYYPAMQEGGFI